MILPSLRPTALQAAGRFLPCSTTRSGRCLSSGTPRLRGGHRQRSFSSLLSSSSPITNKKNDEKEGNSTPWLLQRQQRLQVRSYHATRQREIIAPFIPEMILFVVVAGSWTAYRTYKGKPLTPDEALQAQEAYRKHEEKLQRQWQEHHDKHRSG